ncbi:5-methyltetrahydropteroyltriglutamate--homocysteine methyltransferase [Streptosporangium canum]|uniref:5-methyltetrahydropteroyltriglutamate--homocysteine methyltransferase n=1 Tax=Streptosporangium canum TaxID=324952 RepID=A0A1I3VU65_9ACTN|nr:5-methyltetrahydropteroyltriglutamate--homocysteine methyltransferase [Streptosporangium canum]
MINPLDPQVESAEQVRDRVLQAVRHLSVDQLGTCDDFDFSLLADDAFTLRETAFARVAARVRGIARVTESLGS